MVQSTATRVQDLIGATRAFAFDINSVCSGGAFGIAVADSLICAGVCRTILLIASEVYSRILNPRDFGTYPYFGDGAVLFRDAPGNGRGVINSRLATNGAGRDKICVPGGGTLLPFEKMPGPRSAYFRMKGPDVFDFAVEKGPEIIMEPVRQADVSLTDVKCFICHQANINIIHKIADTLNIPRESFYVNLNRYGNTAGASFLIALDEAISEKVVTQGDLSWGANLLRI